ncbi:Serine/threonine-protein kinase TEL1 [Bienertia sinuspersici]
MKPQPQPWEEVSGLRDVSETTAKWMQKQQKRAKKDFKWYHGGLLFRARADFNDYIILQDSSKMSTQRLFCLGFSSLCLVH